MTQVLSCKTSFHPSNYTLTLQRDILADTNTLLSHLKGLGSSFALITSERLSPLYGKPLEERLNQAGLKTHLFTLPDGEQFKIQSTKESLEQALFEQKLGKDCCILALGGGVVTDLAAFLAATYCRGVSCVLIPTSLLAMVDACIGGKTGINTPYGKNLIGCIYPPKQILIDPSTLSTLPLNEIRNGFVEIIKHALIADADLFTYLHTHTNSLLQLDPQQLDSVIFQSCALKKGIVEEDETEQGERRLLNFGHTIGHALEHLCYYSLSHGEAVALGMLIEADLAMQLGSLSSTEWNQIFSLLKNYGLPLQIPSEITLDSLLETMILDKKSVQSKPRFVILNAIGSAHAFEGAYCSCVDESLIRIAFNRVKDALRCH